MIHVALGQLADPIPQAVQGSVQLSDPQEPVDGRAGGGLVVRLDASFFSLVPELNQTQYISA